MCEKKLSSLSDTVRYLVMWVVKVSYYHFSVLPIFPPRLDAVICFIIVPCLYCDMLLCRIYAYLKQHDFIPCLVQSNNVIMLILALYETNNVIIGHRSDRR